MSKVIFTTTPGSALCHLEKVCGARVGKRVVGHGEGSTGSKKANEQWNLELVILLSPVSVSSLAKRG